MSNVFSEIVEILAENVVVVQNRFKFSQELGISGASIQQLLNNYIQSVATNYELMYGILREWIQIKGNSATLTELQRILKDNNWNFCSDKLSHIAKSAPGPILSPDASTSAKSKVAEIASTFQHSTTIEPFGLGNVVTNFTGRSEEIIKLTEHFHSDNSPFVLMTGLGGIGKTQLATKFALGVTRTVENRSPHTPKKRKTATANSQIVTSCLAGESAQTLQKSISKFSKHLTLPLKDSENNPFKIEKLLKKIIKKLKETVDFYKWLVIIDNVDEMYGEFESAAKTLCSFDKYTFILVTSRNRDIFAGEIVHFPLQQLETSSSLQFVKKSLNIIDDTRDKFSLDLCKQLGNFPLALGQAVAYVKQQQTLSLKGENYSVKDYLGELKKQDTLGLDKEGKLSEYSWSTMKVWNITFEKIKTSYGDRGKQTLKLLDVLSFLDPDNIEMDSIRDILIQFNITYCKENVRECLELLIKYSLINIHGDGVECYQKVCIHRLVQLAVRKRMNSENPSKEVELLTQFWTNCQQIYWVRYKIFEAMPIWKHSTNYQNLDIIRASLVHRWFDIIEFSPRVDYYKFAMEGCELLLRLFGEKSLEYLTMQRRLMTCRPEINDSFLGNLLSLNDKLTLRLGESHKEPLSIGTCIAKVLYKLGRQEESIEYGQRLLSRIIRQGDNKIIKK